MLRRVLELVSGQLEWDIRKLDGVGKRHCGSRFNTNRYLPTLPRCTGRHPILLRAAHGCRGLDSTNRGFLGESNCGGAEPDNLGPASESRYLLVLSAFGIRSVSQPCPKAND